MTERLPGWPWGRALPARVSWYREALALRGTPKGKDVLNGSATDELGIGRGDGFGQLRLGHGPGDAKDTRPLDRGSGMPTLASNGEVAPIPAERLRVSLGHAMAIVGVRRGEEEETGFE